MKEMLSCSHFILPKTPSLTVGLPQRPLANALCTVRNLLRPAPALAFCKAANQTSILNLYTNRLTAARHDA